MNSLAGFWLKLRNRPLFMIGVMVGLAIFAIIAINRISINRIDRRVNKVVSHSPCTNLSAHDCALKLFSLLSPDEKQGMRERVRILRQQERRLQRLQQGGSVQTPSPRTPSNRLHNRAHGGPTATVNPPAPTSQPPLSGGGGQTPSPSPPPTQPRKPLVHVPSVTTPGVGPVPPQQTPPLDVPCIPVMPLITCDH
jgi:hypothetical protein